MDKIIEKNCRTCAHRTVGGSCHVTERQVSDSKTCKPDHSHKEFTFWSQRLGLFARIWRYFFAPEENNE